MRVLCAAALGWMAGILLQGAFPMPPVAAALVAAGAAGAVIAIRRGGGGVAVGLGAPPPAVGRGRPDPPAGSRAFAGQVARPVEPVANGRRIEVALDGGARALVYDDGNVALLPGDRVRFAGVARLPRG